MPPPPAREPAAAPRPAHHLDDGVEQLLAGPFKAPRKCLTRQADIERFAQSQAYQHLMEFIALLNESVKGHSLTEDCEPSPAVEQLLAVLHELESWIDEIPPVQQPMRFGNKAFKAWHQRLCDESERICCSVLPEPLHPAAVELSLYLNDSFGNATRIDYGTGHENLFVAWLCCLRRLQVLSDDDAFPLVTRVFHRYVELMRRLQTTYMMEPAGSHGVWGLDDYCFLPLLWGAAQLIGHAQLKPKSINDKEVVSAMADQYLYMRSIQFIHAVKTGPLAENSPMLYDISGVATWDKVNSGLVKMYIAEVMNKLPVIQHFLFGTILPPIE